MWALIVGLLSFTGQPVASDTLRPLNDTTNRVVTVNRILIIGNKVTRESIISRELDIKSGDTISIKRLIKLVEQDQRKIYNLRLFNKVEVRWLPITQHQVDLLIDVNERWYTFPVPVFELSDRNFNEWWQNYNHDFRRVNYGLRLFQYNFRGRNETLRLTAQFGFTRRFELSYRIPYIDQKQKHGLIFDFSYSQPRNLAYFTDDHKLVFKRDEKSLLNSYVAGISYTFRKSFYQTHTFQYQHLNGSVSDTIVTENSNYYGNGNRTQCYSLLRYYFNSDHRDVFAYTLKGYQFTALVSKAGLGFGRVNLWEIYATYARFFDLGHNYYFSNYSAAYASTPDNQPYALYNALGYKRQLVKGYEVYVVEGPFFVLNKSTFRKKIFSRTWEMEGLPIEQFRYFPVAIYLKSYLDIGYVENYPFYEQMNLNTRLSNRLLAGAGAGLDIVTAYDAVIRLEYTFTREKTQGFFLHMKKEF
jgi:outer membrane protein assembly factor BamA